MSLYVRVYIETRDAAPLGDYVTHEITCFSPAEIVNNGPEDDSRTPGYCVETVCGDQLVVETIHMNWPDGKSCSECKPYPPGSDNQ